MCDLCAQCGLPVGRRPLRGRVRGAEAAFCCYGCYLVMRVSGEPGVRGVAQGLVLRLGLGLFFALNVMVFSLARYGGHFAIPATLLGAEVDAARFNLLLEYILLAFATPVVLLIGLPMVRRLGSEIVHLAFSIDSLVAIATFAAFALSVRTTLTGGGQVYYDTACWLLVLITLGRYLEARAKVRTTGAVESLLALAPPTARRGRADGGLEEVAAASLVPGEVIEVRPGEGIPADGVVLEGAGTVDRAPLTGEATPEAVRAGVPVHAGTTSIDAAFTAQISVPPGARLLDRIAKLMEEARAARGPRQRLADHVAAWVAPVVVGLGVATFFYWRGRVGVEVALLRMLAVWVIACPCALGIATPMALWVGLGVAARNGLLIRTAAALEAVNAIDTVCFDKTGTLTAATLEVAEVRVGRGVGEGEMRRALAALEARSEHPVGRALAAWAGGSAPAAELRTVVGAGVAGRVDGVLWRAGSRRWLAAERVALEPAGLCRDRLRRAEPGSDRRPGSGLVLHDRVPPSPTNGSRSGLEPAGLRHDRQGSTRAVGAALAPLQPGRWVYLARDGEECAAVRLAEQLAPHAAEAVARLAAMGVSLHLLSGDEPGAVEAVAGRLGVPFTVHAGLLPDEKINAIEQLVAAGRHPLMAGDGINDAPALAVAPLGMAMAGGTDLSRNAADVIALHDDLRLVPDLLALGRRVHQTLIANLLWAFSYNFLGVILAAAGRLSPVFAASAMFISSLLVIANSLRLNRWRPAGD